MALGRGNGQRPDFALSDRSGSKRAVHDHEIKGAVLDVVFDDDRLSRSLAQLGCEEAAEDVGATAGRKSDQDLIGRSG
jgi:hypothetical protein